MLNPQTFKNLNISNPWAFILEEYYIYIYAFIRRFYPKRLTVHSVYTFFFGQYVFPGNRTHNLCAANAILYHWATGTVLLTHFLEMMCK